MARDFDGTNDNLSTADNAVTGIDTDLKSLGFHLVVDTQPAALQFLFITAISLAAGNARFQLGITVPTVAGFKLEVRQSGTTTGVWRSDDLSLNTLYHVAITYDRSNVANAPVIYVDGASVTVNLITAPVAITTGDDTIRFGESATGSGDFNGLVGFFTLEGGRIWAAADVNRHRWWGRAPGGFGTAAVNYPFWTDTLAQQGTGGGDLTATGTTVASLPRAARPGCVGAF